MGNIPVNPNIQTFQKWKKPGLPLEIKIPSTILDLIIHTWPM